MSVKALEERKTDLRAQMQSIVDTAKAEKRELNAEEIRQFGECEKEIKDIKNKIESEEKRMSEKNNFNEVEEREMHTFADYIRSVSNGMECRDGEMTKGANGAVIPKTIIKKIIEKVEDISPVYRLATKYNVKGTVYVPKEDTSDDAITVAYGAEFSDLTSHSNKFTSIELTGYLYGALTKVSKSLLNNSDFNLTEWVVAKMAKKIAQFIEGELLNGTSEKVAGVAGSYDSTNMKVTLASKDAVDFDEIIDLIDKVPDAYQADAIFVMNRATRTALRKLKDGEGRYILCYDPTSKFGYTIFGHDVYTSDKATALGTTAKNVIFFGDFSGLAVKEAETAEVQILREHYAAQHAIGIVAWGEIDAKVEDTQKIAVAVTPNS